MDVNKSAAFEKLIFRNSGDSLDHFRRVARILFLQELIDAARMFERSIVRDVGGQRRRGILPFERLPRRSS